MTISLTEALRLKAEFFIEIGFFVCATWSLYDLGFKKLSVAFGIIVVLHYMVSYDRIKWLMSH